MSKCWNCGTREATSVYCGFPLCIGCDNDYFDPEACEGVVINYFSSGKVKSTWELERKRGKHYEIEDEDTGYRYKVRNR